MEGAEGARLVGREQELQQLGVAVDRARSGQPTVVLVEGESGIGKSRLVAEARAAFAEPSDVVITSAAVELSGGDLPYGVVGAALRDFARQERSGLVSTIDPNARATLRELATALRGGATERLDRGVVLDSFVSAVESMSQSRLLWWLVEDLHWADASSRDVLAYLTRDLGPCRLFLGATVRTDEPRSSGVTDFLAGLTRATHVSRLKVPRLTAEQAELLSNRLSTQVLPPSLVKRVVQLGEGIPLWTEELVLGGLQASGPLPESVQGLLAARVMRLPRSARSVIEAVSLTDVAPHDQLGEVCDLTEPEVEQACEQAVEAQVLVVDGDRVGYMFRHALLREAVADGLLPGVRQRLHLRWAQTLDSTSRNNDARPLMAAAHHWAEAGHPARALDVTVEVAALATQVAAKQEQGLLWSRALDLWLLVPDASTRSGLSRDYIAVRCIIAFFAAGDYEHCLERLDTELARPDDDEVRMIYLRLRKVLVLEELARDNDDTEVLDRLPVLAAQLLDAPTASAWLIPALVMTAYYVSEDDVALSMRLAERAIELARSEGDLDMELAAVDVMSWNLGNLGRFEAAIGLLHEGVRVARTKAPSWAFMLEGSQAWYLWGLGRYEESIAAAQSALHYVQRPRAAPERVAWLVESLAESLIAVGRWDEASARLAEVLALSLSGQAAVTLHCLSGVLEVRRGDLDLGREQLQAAQRHTPPQEDTLLSQRVPPHWLAAELAAATGDVAGVRSALAPLWEAAHPEIVSETLWRPLLLAAQVEADVARRPTAARPAQQAAAGDLWSRLFDVSGALHDLGSVTAVWRLQLGVEMERAGRADSADAWAEIASGWGSLGQPYEQANAMLRQADCALRVGDRAIAAGLIAEVAAIGERVAASPLQDRASALARRARLEPVVAGPQDLVVDGVRRPALTAREMEVLALLARGHDNAQVATTLFISAKTASVHVSHILAKLGVSSRTQAVSLALRRGLVPDDLDA